MPGLRPIGLAAALAACTGTVEAPAGGGPPEPVTEAAVLKRELAPDVAVVWDADGTREAVGVRDATVGAVPPSDGRPPLRLAVLDHARDTVWWPAAGRPVLDAALGPDGRVGWIETRGRVCAPRRCLAAQALPEGLDVRADGAVVFVAASATGSDIALADLEGTGSAVRVAAGLGFSDRPIFSPDGGEIVFSAPGPGGLASLFAVRPGEPARQLTNLGLALGPPGPARIPAGFVPPPRDRRSMRWDAGGLRYRAGGGSWRVSPSSGEVVREEPVR